MNTQLPDFGPVSLGPTFYTVKRQSHPSPDVHDLGVEMKWGKPQHTNRIYGIIHADGPYSFDNALVHEDDVQPNVEYQSRLARKTKVGMFIPLTSHLAALYDFKFVTRDIMLVLAEVDAFLPTGLGIANIPRHAGKAGHQSQEAQTGMLSTDLEIDGYRLTDLLEEEHRAMLNISWLSKPGGRRFFVGVIEMRPTADGITAKWMLPGPCGVNSLLRREFGKRCQGLDSCLTAAGQKHCLAGIKPSAGKTAKHIRTWQVNSPQSIPDAKSSSTASQRMALR